MKAMTEVAPPDAMAGISRREPAIRGVGLRTVVGATLLAGSVLGVAASIGTGAGKALVLSLAAWAVSVFVTHKYVHKYPQRYVSYVIASHLKASVIMAALLWIGALFLDTPAAPLYGGFLLFALLDLIVSLPSRHSGPSQVSMSTVSLAPVAPSTTPLPPPGEIDATAVLAAARACLDPAALAFLADNLPETKGALRTTEVVGDLLPDELPPLQHALVVGTVRANDVRRLNLFLTAAVGRVAMGGYLLLRYTPLENTNLKLQARHSGTTYRAISLANFIWYRALPKIPWLDAFYFARLSWLDRLLFGAPRRRNRMLSKAEMWGRLCFWGLDIVAESRGDDERFVLARRLAAPVQNRRPSYYPVVALEKVALDGGVIRMHKIRTMYPFSEFLQKRIFEDHGLTATGKFANDFRLTEIGKFLRRYWLDELPQIFDWLRGDVKLVGMRATSRHFLGLYPKELYDLYIQIKPGLVPPIFNESTGGFDKIVEIELTYLKHYIRNPVLTDIRYFFRTFADIVLRGVRSK